MDQQPADWNEFATVYKSDGHQIRLAYSNHGRAMTVSCICRVSPDPNVGPDRGFVPIQEIDFGEDVWVPYVAYHRGLGLAEHEFRPQVPARLGTLPWHLVNDNTSAEEKDKAE